MKRKSELRAVAARATDTASAIHSAAEQELNNSVGIEQSLNRQCQETEQVAAAVEELTHSISEVASASSVASNLANDADTQAVKGMESINSTISEVDDLAEELGQAHSIVNQLSQDSQKIDSILEVITAISEQTNLLALNAAIEAARAGDAGRGFAVVADEVRDLASKTANSANEIHTMIKQFKETSQNAVVAMDKGMSLSDNCKVRAHETGEVLTAISEILNRVADSSVQIASAVEQQATVTQEVNQNVSNIKTLADDTSLASKTSLDRTTELVEQLEGLERLMKQFQS
jgi:methyl-accepting chemotaxis protein